MSFKEVQDLECEVAYSLGGTDKKSGKKNPTQVEGYYIGNKQIPDKFSKTGFGSLHVFQTESGKVGIFGKTDLNRKMLSVEPGTMTRVAFDKFIPTKFNDMAKYKVAVDTANTIEVDMPTNLTASDTTEDTSDLSDEESDYEEVAPVDEAPLPRPSKPSKPASAPDAARQARVLAQLGAGKTRN